MRKALIIIPTFNEIDNIERLIRAILTIHKSPHILVVDDNSPDLTSELVSSLQVEFKENLFLLNRPIKEGLGKAYIDGFKWGLKRDYNYFIQMDADFSHDPNSIINLFNSCHKMGNDVAVGSRYINGINVINWPISRILLSYFASFYVRIITGMPIKDPTSGFVCYKRIVLEALNLERIKFIGYAFQIEMKFKAFCKKFKLKEIPIIFKDRTRGESKLTNSIIFEAVSGVIYMKLKQILGKIK